MRIRHKPWAAAYLLSLPFFLASKEQLITYLKENKDKQFVLEIGVGKGDFIVSMAKKYPDLTFVGIELNSSVLALASQKIEKEKLANIVLLSGDALVILEGLGNSPFQTIFLNHSDPWPKARHEKRRLTSNRFLKVYEQILQEKGRLIFKTDNDGMALYSRINMSEFGYKMLKYDEDYQDTDEFDAITEYETNFRTKGITIKRMIFEKRDYVN